MLNDLVLVSLFLTVVQGLIQFKRLELEHKATLLRTQTSKYDLWIEQKLDNFHPTDHRTWMQRYFVQRKYDQPNGPVFLQIGGEGPANPIWMEGGHWITMAKEFGALCFYLEHRFYGKSHPTSDASDENLSFLSSEQALGDVANFIVNTTKHYKLQDRKWIVFGGSYSGALSIWARLKYPHLVSGSVSSSAPLVALLDFSGYLEVVSDSLNKFGSSSCVHNIAEATRDIELQLQTADGRQELGELFNLCKPLDGTDFDNKNFQQDLAGNVMEIVQYNRDNRAFEGSATSKLTIATVCSMMDDTSIGPPIHRYAAFNRVIIAAFNQTCVDASYSKFIKDMRSTSWSELVGGRSWLYQTCTEFGWYQASDASSQPFVGFPLNFTLDQCKSVFNIDPPQIEAAIARTNENYGALKVAHLVSNVTLYNGGVDPWSDVSYAPRSQRSSAHPPSPPLQVSSGVIPIRVPDTAHCAIMYPASPSDSPLLTQARKEVESIVATWLGAR